MLPKLVPSGLTSSPSAVATITDDCDILCLLIWQTIFHLLKTQIYILNIFFQVHKGVHGFVKDKTGKPISKAVIVLNEGIKVHTKDGGYFHVLLAPGVHNINAIADGYQQQHSQVRHST